MNYLANVNKSLDQGSVVLINKLTSNTHIGFHVFLFAFNEIVFAKENIEIVSGRVLINRNVWDV